MCGIFGIAFLQGHKVEDPKIVKIVLRKLLEESKKRGTDATGIAFATDSDISVIKHNINAEEFIKAKFYEEAEKEHIDKTLKRLKVILGHTRARTKGTPTNRDNNHPIVANRVVGIHNGSISNDDELFSKYSEAFPGVFKRKAEVDTEIIFRLIDHYRHHVGLQMYDAVASTNKLIKGGYACAFLDAAAPWMLHLFKGWAPTDVQYFPEYGLVIFASSDAFIKTAIKGFGFGQAISMSYDRESCMFVNTMSNKITRFGFKECSIFTQ